MTFVWGWLCFLRHPGWLSIYLPLTLRYWDGLACTTMPPVPRYVFNYHSSVCYWLLGNVEASVFFVSVPLSCLPICCWNSNDQKTVNTILVCSWLSMCPTCLYFQSRVCSCVVGNKQRIVSSANSERACTIEGQSQPFRLPSLGGRYYKKAVFGKTWYENRCPLLHCIDQMATDY